MVTDQLTVPAYFSQTDQKLCQRRLRLDIRKYVTFCNRVIDNWNSLSVGYINCNTINTFKKYFMPELESGAVQFL